MDSVNVSTLAEEKMTKNREALKAALKTLGKPRKRLLGRPVARKARSPVNGLTSTQFFEAIFKTNEARPKSKKLTDEQILAMWEEAFGGLPPEGDPRRPYRIMKRMQKIRDYRQRWNRGELYTHQLVTVISWRYNHKGERVDFSDGVTLMTPEAIKERIEYYKQKAGIKWKVS